jgi:hypothetical protein
MSTTVTNPAPPGEMPDPSDFAAYDAWRSAGGDVESGDDGEFVAPATGDEDQSQSDAEAELAAAGTEGEEAQAAGEGEEATDATGEASEAPQETQQGKKRDGIEKRFRKMNNNLAESRRENQELRERLARLEGIAEGEQGDEAESAEGEQVEQVVAAPAAAARPALSEYESMEEWLEADSAWLQGRLEAAKAEAKAEKDRELLQAANQAHQAEWNRQTVRFADYNEVVTDDVKVSHAMTAVMKGTMSPEDGTRVAYYLGKHPEESLKIAEATLAPTEGHWVPAQQRAAIALGRILAKLDADPGKGVPLKRTPLTASTTTKAAGTAAASKATRPPAPMRGQSVQSSRADAEIVMDPKADYKKWEAAREREIAAKTGRR